MSEGTKYQPIEELDVFLVFESLCDEIWDLSLKFNWFAKATIGRQMVRAADSVGANLVEGDGRFSDPEAIHFFFIARGSARELRYWIKRCEKRRLIPAAKCADLIERIHRGAIMLSHLIKFRKQSLPAKRVREERATYVSGASSDPFAEILD